MISTSDHKSFISFMLIHIFDTSIKESLVGRFILPFHLRFVRRCVFGASHQPIRWCCVAQGRNKDAANVSLDKSPDKQIHKSNGWWSQASLMILVYVTWLQPMSCVRRLLYTLPLANATLLISLNSYESLACAIDDGSGVAVAAAAAAAIFN